MKYLNKKTVTNLEKLEAQRSELSGRRTTLSLQNRELLKEYDRLTAGASNGAFAALLKKKERHVKLRDRIEELAAEVEGIEGELEELDAQIRAARLQVYNDYVKAAEAQDETFRKAFATLQQENQKLADIFDEAASVLKLSGSGTTLPHYSRLALLQTELEEKPRFWNRSKNLTISKLSEPDPDLVEVVYTRRKPRCAYFLGSVSRVPKKTALKDIDEGFAVPADEYDPDHLNTAG